VPRATSAAMSSSRSSAGATRPLYYTRARMQLRLEDSWKAASLLPAWAVVVAFR